MEKILEDHYVQERSGWSDLMMKVARKILHQCHFCKKSFLLVLLSLFCPSTLNKSLFCEVARQLNSIEIICLNSADFYAFFGTHIKFEEEIVVVVLYEHSG